jgi:hypothetical protein
VAGDLLTGLVQCLGFRVYYAQAIGSIAELVGYLEWIRRVMYRCGNGNLAIRAAQMGECNAATGECRGPRFTP